MSILKEAEKIDHEKPGYRNGYSSAVPQAFVVIAERIENKTWAKLPEERVWGDLPARLSMPHHLTLDGASVAHELLSSTAEDSVRFGMLFTLSWHKAAVVSAEVLKRLQTGGSPEGFRKGYRYEGVREEFGEAALMASFQFDAVFEDGALWKHATSVRGTCIDSPRDFVGVSFSTTGYVPPYGEDKMPAWLSRAAEYLAGE